MRFAIFSDLHANYYAIQAVGMDAANVMGIEEGHFWCLGDIVGYGPHPVKALQFLKHFIAPTRWVMGNHDAMFADIVLKGETVPKSFPIRVAKGKGLEIQVRGVFLRKEDWYKTNNMPVEVILLNRETVRAESDVEQFWHSAFTRERTRPVVFDENGIRCVLIHASQVSPLSRYLYAWDPDFLINIELEHLRHLQEESGQTIVQFYGHTHVPTFIRAFWQNDEFKWQAEKVYPGKTFHLEDGALYLINPGSVGQPRDRDVRASYVVFDSEARTVTFRRVPYEYRRTAEDLAHAGYPDALIRRLFTALATKDIPEEWSTHLDEARNYE